MGTEIECVSWVNEIRDNGQGGIGYLYTAAQAGVITSVPVMSFVSAYLVTVRLRQLVPISRLYHGVLRRYANPE